ncbi:MAG: lipoyl synthase [Candidatus Omnitrophica bacterium CG08_land_8_20_14_0_20_41_16]|uniref:Lipoyl synthase n=1 Tax=Candidatus Sherwoodlollariibacterium unditelluris TaxID=1974757 RepID=A0A2G9YIL1_9BACT|nr:MAG: lipoyl synthase [Candidatus Omnitrophica bacterium CG23_combo_of_CG06-09_8_20_14_all_41_10]PIS34267.1 MAG: lipoyl synthase [Candidatus Omnitrophica bacterium CG08_land_8_20_14_0_20_41_16]
MAFNMKPAWLNKKISLRDCADVKTLLKGLRLNTVCEEALCPNMGECFARRQVTFIILGTVCTRSCRFCGVAKGLPLPPDADEPRRIAQAVEALGLTYVVITSVTRDDLPDGGGAAFAETIRSLRRISREIMIETLIPDFNVNEESLRIVADAQPDVIAHNIETVARLYKKVRPGGASYAGSLEVLRKLKKLAPNIPLKSGLMLGLEETRQEVYAVFDDLVKAGCSYLSIGQYLAPSNNHVSVKEYISPEIFDQYKEEAIARGFRYVKSAPYVRSSYLAAEYQDNSCQDILSPI